MRFGGVAQCPGKRVLLGIIVLVAAGAGGRDDNVGWAGVGGDEASGTTVRSGAITGAVLGFCTGAKLD